MPRVGDTVRAVPDGPTHQAGRERPDDRPARLMMGAGALAAVTVIGAGLVDFPNAVADTGTPPSVAPSIPVAGSPERPVRYIHLGPGQKAPKGAKVIREAPPTPRVVVRRIAPPAAHRSGRPVARTRQSGG